MNSNKINFVVYQGNNCECVHIIIQICYYSKCGIVLQGFNLHLPFGNHLLGHLIYFFIGTRGFSVFSIVYIIDDGVQKNSLIFNSNVRSIKGLSS
jgi:hypothetical protein